MGKRITVDVPSRQTYTIMITDGFQELAGELEALDIGSRRLCIVTDSQVGELYADHVSKALSPYCREVLIYTFPAGESSKHLGSIPLFY